MLAEMGKTMLERLGYSVTVKTSSIEALTTIQNQPEDFDLVPTLPVSCPSHHMFNK